jgi:hypothetical protein
MAPQVIRIDDDSPAGSSGRVSSLAREAITSPRISAYSAMPSALTAFS